MASVRTFLLAEDDDDDKMIFTDIVQTLQVNGNVLLHAVDNGVQVLQLLENCEQLPDLVILDQNMPQMSGRETLAAIKQNARFIKIPVVIYSTYNDARLSEECYNLGAEEIITKPDSYEGFTAMIRSLMDKYQ